jgi:hypothetical protein
VEEVEENPGSQRRNPLPGLGAAARSKVGEGEEGKEGMERLQERFGWSRDAPEQGPCWSLELPVQDNSSRLPPTNGILCVSSGNWEWDGDELFRQKPRSL